MEGRLNGVFDESSLVLMIMQPPAASASSTKTVITPGLEVIVC